MMPKFALLTTCPGVLNTGVFVRWKVSAAEGDGLRLIRQA
jgi:hypothetical protein